MQMSVTNLDDGGQAQRIRRGAVLFVVASTIAVAAVSYGVARPYRLLLAIPFLVAINITFQGLYKT